MAQEEAIKVDCSVLFCDIRNFTTMFRDKNPIEAINFANSVLSVLADKVEESGGTVDRFTGDGFMCYFGVENDVANHHELACKTAIALLGTLRDINAERFFEVKSVVNFGIGIHAGEAAYGKIKTHFFSQKTLLGDMVNTAARIESLTKHFNVDILTSEVIYDQVKNVYDFQKMPPRDVSGKEHLQSYWLLPVNEFK